MVSKMNGHVKKQSYINSREELFNLSIRLPLIIVLFVPLSIAMSIACKMNKKDCKHCKFRGKYWDVFLRA